MTEEYRTHTSTDERSPNTPGINPETTSAFCTRPNPTIAQIPES